MSDKFKCIHPMCRVSPRTGGQVFRVNAKGQPAIWACREHLRQTDAQPIHETVDLLARAVEGK